MNRTCWEIHSDGAMLSSSSIAYTFPFVHLTIFGCLLTNNFRYGEEVENYLEVYLRTPGLEKRDIARALLARGNARKTASERLLAKAQQDFQAVAKLDPSNRELQGYLRKSNMVCPRYTELLSPVSACP